MTAFIITVLIALASTSHTVNANADDGCTLHCVNGGVCRFGSSDFGFNFDEPLPFTERSSEDGMHCACKTGWTGVRCEIKFKVCADDQHTCFNGGECMLGIGDDGLEYRHCDCDPAESDLSSSYAGTFCQHAAQVFCAPGNPKDVRHTFCVNGGRCADAVASNEDHPGCECPPGWEGMHCEYAEGKVPAHALAKMKNMTKSDESDESKKSVLIPFLSISLLVLVVGVTLVIVRRRRRAKSRATSSSSNLSGTLDAEGKIFGSSRYKDAPSELELKSEVI